MFNGKFVVWSFEHAAYWRAASSGYCVNLMGAGLYDEAEAREIERGANQFSDRKNEEARDADAEWRKLMGSASPNTIGSTLLGDHEALKRADRIIAWMAPHIGRMCPPPEGIAELNDHWMLMQRYGINQPRDPKTDRAPLDQRSATAQPTRDDTRT